MPLRSLIVDFNSFFASVEQQEHPEWRGRPVGVVPVMAETTCCIAASYEAKRHGVRTGTSVAEARRLCPGIVFVEGRHELYIQYHEELNKVIDSCLPVTEVLSIDEVLCDLRGPWREEARALRSAREIKERIARRVGECLRSSIGIAPNPFLAKTASDMQKPDGLVVLRESDLPDALHRLELRDFCGIGKRMELRLNECGITTVRQLCAADSETLYRAWGSVEGERMFAALRGENVRRPETDRGTVGHAHVLEPIYRTRELAEAVLHRLLQKAAARLRKLGFLAAGLAVDIDFVRHVHWHEEMTFLESQDTIEFIRVFGLLWRRYPVAAPPPFRVSVTFFDLLRETNVTLRLQPDARPALARAMDALNTNYGRNTVYFGGAQPALDSAPTRIAFTNIPIPETERALAPVLPPRLSRRRSSSFLRRASRLCSR